MDSILSVRGFKKIPPCPFLPQLSAREVSIFPSTSPVVSIAVLNTIISPLGTSINTTNIMFDIHDICKMELWGGPGRPTICNNTVEEVYNNKHKWSTLYDNYTFHFDDGTNGILKKFPIRPCFYSSNRDIEEHEALSGGVCDNPLHPRHVWLILPRTILQADDGELGVKLFCRDCTNIVNITKEDFKRGNMIDPNDASKGEYKFSFGERVYDKGNNEHAIVVGQTKCFVYIISEATAEWDWARKVSIKPVRRKVGAFESVPSKRALNYRVIAECAAMENFIVVYGEASYIM